MIRATYTALTSAGMVLVLACADNADGPRAVLRPADGVYRYVASAGAGLPILEGTVHLTFGTDTAVEGTGTYLIHWVPGADTTQLVGEQVGNGTLTASWIGDRLVLNLNPGYADNNVFVQLQSLSGTGSLRGEWEWSGLAGPMAHGAAELTPR